MPIKKSIFLLFFTIPVFVNAQIKGEFFYRPVIGFNFAIPVGDGIDIVKKEIEENIEIYNNNDVVSFNGSVLARKGFNAGIEWDYYFIDNIAFSSSLCYSQKGYVLKELTSIKIGLKSKIDEKSSIKLNYLDLPLLLKYHFYNNIQIAGGMLVSILLTDKVLIESDEEYETYDDNWNVITMTNHEDYIYDYDRVYHNDPNAILTGFQFRISYILDRLSFSLRFNKNSSFGDIKEKSNNKNITLQFSTGYNF